MEMKNNYISFQKEIHLLNGIQKLIGWRIFLISLELRMEDP